MGTRPAIFKWRQTKPGLILRAVRWYLRYFLSLRDVEELLEERSLDVDQAAALKVATHPVWSKISNALKRLGFHSHNFLTQLLSETSRACTIRVRDQLWGGSGMIWARMLA